MRNVIVVPGCVEIEKGESSDGVALPHQARKLQRKGRPLYFSRQVARNWVKAGDAEWLGKGEKRVRLTSSGQRRFLEMKTTPRLHDRSAVLGEAVVLSDEPWARAFENQQLRPQIPERRIVNREIS